MKIIIDVEELDNAIIEVTERDTWNLDTVLALVIRDSIIEFRKGATESTPILLDDNSAWLNTLDTIIRSFDLIQDDIMNYNHHKEEIQLGLDNFAKNFPYLWS